MDTTNIENARMILEERNRRKGAFELGFIQFQSVYRYVVRAIENDHRAAELVLFTLNDAAVSDDFGAILGKSLRRSDVFTKGGKSQYLVLLSDMSDADDQPILKRVLEQWGESEKGAAVKVTYESALLRAGD